MRERTRRDSQASVRPGADAWARVYREISDVAGKTPQQIQQEWFRRAGALLRYHARQSLNPAYGELLGDAGVDPAGASQPSLVWSQVPVIDKHWLAGAGYHRRPACPGHVLVMGTSGSLPAKSSCP